MGLKKICNFSIPLQLFKYKFFLKTVNSVLRVLTLERGVAGSPQSRTHPSPPSVFCLYLKMAFKVVNSPSQEVTQFFLVIPQKYEVYMLINFCFSPVNLLWG